MLSKVTLEVDRRGVIPKKKRYKQNIFDTPHVHMPLYFKFENSKITLICFLFF